MRLYSKLCGEMVAMICISTLAMRDICYEVQSLWLIMRIMTEFESFRMNVGHKKTINLNVS